MIGNPDARVCRACGGEVRGLVCRECGAVGDPAEGAKVLIEILKKHGKEAEHGEA